MANALFPQKKPKILLINFSKEDATTLRNKGYNIDEGVLTGAVYHFPSPSYEYDIVVARFDSEGFQSADAEENRSHSRAADFEIMKQRMNSGGFALVFAGNFDLNIRDFEAVGIHPRITTIELDVRDTQYNVGALPPATPPWVGLGFVSSLVSKFSESIARPVAVGITWSTREGLPIVSLAANHARQSIAAMGFRTNYSRVEPSANRFVPVRPVALSHVPNFIVFPALTDGYIRVVNEVFSQLPTWRPDLFPSGASQDWIESKDYWSKDMIQKEEEVALERKRSEESIKEKEAALTASYEADEMMRLLITADDSDDYPEDKNLTSATLFALTSLGFHVEKKEEELRDGKRREDLLCMDDDYAAVVECKGTVVVNPPEKYHGQILQHLLSTKGAVSRGILVINSDRKRDAFSRTPLYEGEGQFWETSEDITVLSTVDLYRLCRAVTEGKITPDEARELIKTPGRVEYPKKEKE